MLGYADQIRDRMTIAHPVAATPIEETGVGSAAPVGVLTTSLVEAQCWRGTDQSYWSFASGGDGGRARDCARKMVAEDVRGLVSFGLAVGLAPVARPGDLIVADSVALPSGRSLRADCAWRDQLLDALAAASLPVKVARVAGRETLLFTPVEKQRTFRQTFAAALDTESHVVAEAASAAGLPFLVARVIVEPAEVNRPFAIQAALAPDGAWRGSTIGARLCLRPWELPAAWRFMRESRAGVARLRQVARLLPLPIRAPVVAGT